MYKKLETVQKLPVKKHVITSIGGGNNRGRGAKVNTGPRMGKKRQAP